MLQEGLIDLIETYDPENIRLAITVIHGNGKLDELQKYVEDVLYVKYNNEFVGYDKRIDQVYWALKDLFHNDKHRRFIYDDTYYVKDIITGRPIEDAKLFGSGHITF